MHVRLHPDRVVAALLAVVASAFVGGARAAPGAPTDTCSSPNCPIAIQDATTLAPTQDRPAVPYPSTITFGHGDPCCPLIEKVAVNLEGLTHGALANVDVLLVYQPIGGGPQRVVELMSDVGGPFPVTDLDLTFDQTAAAPLPETTPPASGTYKPTNYTGIEPPCARDAGPVATGDPFPAPAPPPPSPAAGYGQSLEAFNGIPVDGGTWRLYVGDDCVGGGGSISSWSLTFTISPEWTMVTRKRADAATVDAGSPIGFTIDAGNPGGEGAFDVWLVDRLPAGTGLDWSVSSATAANCWIVGSVGSEELRCYTGGLVPGDGFSVHVTSPTSSRSCGTYGNTASAYASNKSSSSASASTRVVDCPTAVRVASFAATSTTRGVLLRWRAAAEVETLGYNVYRGPTRLNRCLIPSDGGPYSWLDRDASRSGSVVYRLETVALDGGRSWSRTTIRRSGTR